MPYLIDGHNLIPKIPGLHLADMDDEMRLVELLQEFCRVTRKQVEVFFDNAPPGQARARVFGNVTARFIRSGQTADRAIQEKLKRLGGEARNWSVVSSDGQVQAAGRAAKAVVIPSEAFAQQLIERLQRGEGKPDSPEQGLSAEEVDEWLKLFGREE